MKNLYYVRANDGRTDTAVSAKNKTEVKTLMKINPWWKKHNLRPVIIEKMGQVTEGKD